MSKRTSSDLYLAADQQGLMAAALNSNEPGTAYTSPAQPIPGSGQLSFDDDSPYLDFDNDADFDNSFDLGPHARMIGDLPEEQLPTNDELHDKRKSIDGKDDDDDEGGGKRREGEDKTGKKPGRKPLTSEPTSKRKAQNRAAQRAFRERKEKHLRDLETKVEDLEKASEATSQENGLLRAQVERLQVELKEYRKRLSWISNGGASRSNGLNAGSNHRAGSFNQQSDFQFEFPKFGDLPQLSGAAKSQDANQTRKASATNSNGGAVRAAGTANASRSNSQAQTRAQSSSMSQSPLGTTIDLTASPRPTAQSGSIDSLSSLFSPSILESARHGSFSSYFAPNHPTGQNAAISNSSLSNTNSPTSSSDEFDPILFGDYRETADSSMLSQDFGSFFNDAYPLPDLGSPTHNFNDVSSDQLASAQAARAVLLKQVEAAKEDGDEVVPDNDRPMSCNKIWDRLQSMEKFRNGEIDIDNLCSELRAKAKCSEGGAVVDKKDVDKILSKTK
ncbi:hypothetical protein DV737_g2787, partial [Chaetothyriales sp. CBS 132003]